MYGKYDSQNGGMCNEMDNVLVDPDGGDANKYACCLRNPRRR